MEMQLIYLQNSLLPEICNSGLEDLHILLSVDIYGNAAASTLGMCHLAKDSSVRTCDTLDRIIGTVHIPLFIPCNITARITVTGSHLAVCKESLDGLLGRNKPSFSVRSRVDINAAKFSLCKPRGLVSNNLCIDHLGNMASDGIISQRRRNIGLSGDLSIRYQAKLDQRLEAVAHAKYQSVSFIQQFFYRFFELRVLERSRKEFCGTVRLVACAEAAPGT